MELALKVEPFGGFNPCDNGTSTTNYIGAA
jgi:hypothetical protein